MTLIVGFRCSDGILIAADRKIMRGGEVDFADKIFVSAGVALAFEGLTGIRDDFLLLLDAEFRRSRGFESLYQVKLIVEDIIAELSGRYAERLGSDAGIGVLLGGLTEIRHGKAQLYYVHGQGYGEAVNYRCSGHGEEYAHSLAKFLYDSALTVEQNALRAAFAVSYVADDVDINVGGDPQVAMILDDTSNIQFADDQLVKRAISRAKRAKQRLPQLFGI